MGVEHAGAARRRRAVALELVDAGGRRTHATVPAVPPVVGNGRALDCSFALTCAGVSDGFAESMSAAVPATSGAEKLVPSEASKLSV